MTDRRTRVKTLGSIAREVCVPGERYLVIIVDTSTGDALTATNLDTRDAVGVLAAMLGSDPEPVK